MKLRHLPIALQAAGAWLEARLSHAPDAGLLVLIIGAGDCSPANLHPLADTLADAHYASIDVDLLTDYERNRDPDARYNISLLSQRLEHICAWIAHQPMFRGFPVAVVASGSASAAAIRVGAIQNDRFCAIVSCGGRLDLAGASALANLRTPLRLISVADDHDYRASRPAFERLSGEHDLKRLDTTASDWHGAVMGWLERHLERPGDGAST